MLQTIRRSLFGERSSRPALRLSVVRGVCTAFAALALAAAPAQAQKITEVVADHVGSPDTYEYIEVAASPALVHPTGQSDTVLVPLSAYTLVELDGTTDPGKILHTFAVGTTNGSGFWSTGYLTSTLEKPAFTILLVSGFAGAVGDDLDAGNDGTLDTTPWTAIADGVAFSDGAAGARTYAAPVLGPGFDGVATAPGGASRFPYYGDADSVTDWKRNDFDGDGLPGLTGTLAAGEARNTPGGVNRVSVVDYYAGIDATNQAALRSTLHARIGNHIRYPYTSSSTDTWDILNLADQDPVDSGAILDIYKNATYTKITGGTGVYNREHSWPNSYGFNNATETSEYTDAHHLFASDTDYNSARGNLSYGTCSASCTENPTLFNHGIGGGSGTHPGNSDWLSGSGGSGIYEVWDHMKGDLARASLYMDVRYEGGPHPYTGTTEQNLQLTDNVSLIQTNQPYMGRLAVLLAWSAADSPDDAERARNEIVESFQGNRNPFIDHPEWVECVFQGLCGGNASVSFSGLASANDPNLCAVTGVDLSWSAPAAWNDDCTSGCNRGFRVLRDGVALVAGGCAGPLAATATSCADATGAAGVTYAYAVEAFNHENETSTGNKSISVADRTNDGLPPAVTVGPSASSAASSSFTVTWTTDEPSDSRLEYGSTASYGSTAYVAAPVTTHTLTVTGLTAGTEYHFRAGSADPCGNGPTWSLDGTVTTAAASATLGIGGWQVAQTDPILTYTLPPGTNVPAGGYVVIGRYAAKAAFETFWGVTLGPNVVYLNANNMSGPPVINGSETFTLKNASGVDVDGPTIVLPSTSQSVRRIDPCLPSGSPGSWAAGALATATPGTGAGAGCGTGLVINEFSDASNYFYEFVELYYDAPAALAPSVTTGAPTGVTTTGATVNGTVNPNGVATSAAFEWGPTTSYGQTTAVQTMGSGTSVLPVSAPLSGLVSCAVYHYRATATSGAGTVTGSDQTFQTTCTGGRLYTVTPCRMFDSRDFTPLVDGVPIDLNFRDNCGIPPTALAVAANVTVTAPSLPGYLSVYPRNIAPPGTSVVHFGTGRTRAAMTIVKLSDDGEGVARFLATVPTGGTVHFIVDVSGYFE